MTSDLYSPAATGKSHSVKTKNTKQFFTKVGEVYKNEFHCRREVEGIRLGPSPSHRHVFHGGS